jgi:hypothetical protein
MAGLPWALCFTHQLVHGSRQVRAGPCAVCATMHVASTCIAGPLRCSCLMPDAQVKVTPGKVLVGLLGSRCCVLCGGWRGQPPHEFSGT